MMFMEILTLGEKIKSKRKELNMTLKDLAGDRITPGQISLVESGKSNPSIDLLEYISEKLNTDIEYLLENEEKQAGRICEYYTSIAESALSSEDLVKAEDFIIKGMHFAKSYNLTYYTGKLKMAYARLNYAKADYEKAQQYCLSANNIFLKTDNIGDIINSFMLLGRITLKLGYVNTALNYFMQSDNVFNENKYMDEMIKTRIYYYIAICKSKSGNIDEAINYAVLARDRLNNLNNKKEYAKMLLVLSISYGEKNKIKEALQYAREAKKVYEELDNIHETANIEANLGVLFAKDNKITESFAHLNNAIKLKQQIDDDSLADTVLKLCSNYLQTGQIEKAYETVNDVLTKLKDNQNDYRIKCYDCIYKIYRKQNNMKKAEEILLKIIKLLNSMDCKQQLADYYIVLGKFYTETGRNDLALENMNKGLDLYKEIGVILHE